MPGLGAENRSALFENVQLIFRSFESSRAISKPAPNPDTHQTLVETLSDISWKEALEQSGDEHVSKSPFNKITFFD